MGYNSFRKTAVEAARKGGAVLMKHFGTGVKVRHKGAIDLVTEADLRSEKCITDILRDRFPDHQILSEETTYPSAPSPYKWIIDPLDGTTNYAHNYPCFAVSIGLELNGVMALGVVFNPVLDELFVAERGHGATLNGKRIRVSKTLRLDTSLLATGFPYDIRTHPDNNLNHFGHFALRSLAIRRPGSAAIDLCYVAVGRFDGFWELRLSPWDMAAGTLIVQEAGGKLTDFQGRPLDIYGGQVVASNRKIHTAMLDVLQMNRRRRRYG